MLNSLSKDDIYTHIACFAKAILTVSAKSQGEPAIFSEKWAGTPQIMMIIQPKNIFDDLYQSKACLGSQHFKKQANRSRYGIVDSSFGPNAARALQLTEAFYSAPHRLAAEGTFPSKTECKRMLML